jgi:hypothetical protein
MRIKPEFQHEILTMSYFNNHKDRAKKSIEDSKHFCEEIANEDGLLFVEVAA